MFDIAPSEFLLVAVVALVVIGPKDLPKALRVLGYWVGRARGVARQFRAGFDEMVREAELAEMEKKWAAENERIMREHGAGGEADAEAAGSLAAAGVGAPASSSEGAAEPAEAAEHVAPEPSVDLPQRDADVTSRRELIDRASARANMRASRGGQAAPPLPEPPVAVERPHVDPAPVGAAAPAADPAAS